MRGKELLRRHSGGFEISLKWDRITDSVGVVVEAPATDEVFELPARRDNVLDVFYHPFAYLGEVIVEPIND